jgi:hypothetical protein
MEDPKISTLWANILQVLFKNEEITVVKYSGQPHGRLDNLILSAKNMCGGDYGKRKFIGDILSVTELNKTNVRNFIIIVKNTTSHQPEFRTKNDLCRHLGLSPCDDVMQGITRHNEI